MTTIFEWGMYLAAANMTDIVVSSMRLASFGLAERNGANQAITRRPRRPRRTATRYPPSTRGAVTISAAIAVHHPLIDSTDDHRSNPEADTVNLVSSSHH